MGIVLNEIRLLIAEILLGWCISLAPDNEEGERLSKMIAYYFRVVEQEIADEEA